jgi:hypothetical protein
MNLVVNLFKAYAMVTNQNFQICIQQIENQHDDGTYKITGPELMQKALNVEARQFKSTISMTVLAMNGTTSISISECGPFDSDCALVGIVNRCLGVRTDIPGEILPYSKIIKGFGGSSTATVWTGTIHWSWDNDQGIIQKMVIQNSYYVP